MARKQTKRQKAALKGWATRRARAKVRKLFSVGGLSVARINSFKGKLMAHAVPLEVLQQRQQTGAQHIIDADKAADAAARKRFSLPRLVRGWFP